MEPGVHVATTVIASPPTPSWCREARTLAKYYRADRRRLPGGDGDQSSDTLIIGRVCRRHRARGRQPAAHVLFSLLFACMGVISIVGAFAVQSHGAGDPVAVARAIRQGFWVATMLSLPAMVIGWYLPTVSRSSARTLRLSPSPTNI